MVDAVKLIPNISSSPEPTLLRARYVHDLVKSVNRNTLAVGPVVNTKEQANRQGEVLGSRYTDEGAITIDGDTDGSLSRESMFPDDPSLGGFFESWDEIARRTSTVRVRDPDDENTFVDVSRIDSVMFVKSDGTVAILRFTN